ncbi:MAG: DUF3842 family protein [Syntrophomonadaceae bacterium]|nr:DUF3842 family protein [Syntrophomonadaceae bacterium]
MKIAIVDGQGGGIGSFLIEKLRTHCGNSINLIGLGTNALASASMLKAGANESASGENAIVWNAYRVDFIIGSVAIIAANSFSGELTPKMAEAIASSSALKLLIPLNKANIIMCGMENSSLPLQVDLLVKKLKELMPPTGKEA